MFDIRLISGSTRTCGINIDLRTYPAPAPARRQEILGITDAQVDFVQRAVLGDYLAGTETWLMYSSATVIVPDHIPRSVAQLLTMGVDLPTVSILEVGQTTPKPCRLGYADVHPFAKTKPLKVVTLMTTHNQDLDEFVSSCIAHGRDKRFLIYSYRGKEPALGLMHRIKRLSSHHDGFLVTNEPMIKYLED